MKYKLIIAALLFSLFQTAYSWEGFGVSAGGGYYYYYLTEPEQYYVKTPFGGISLTCGIQIPIFESGLTAIEMNILSYEGYFGPVHKIRRTLIPNYGFRFYFLDYQHTVRPSFFIGFGMLPLFSYHASLAIEYKIYDNAFIQLSSFIALEPVLAIVYDNPPAFFNLSYKYYFMKTGD